MLFLCPQNIIVIVAEIYYNRCVRVWRCYSGELLELLLSIDKLLSTDEHFLLGVWLDSAKNLSTSQQERRLYEYNARNQITLWGPNGEVCTGTITDVSISLLLAYLSLYILQLIWQTYLTASGMPNKVDVYKKIWLATCLL